MRIRLAKFLALAGVASRRKAEILIKESLVLVNGKIVDKIPSFIETDKDIVEYKNKKIELKKDYTYIILNKPVNYLSSHKEQGVGKTLFSLLDEKYQKIKLVIVGRLDKNSRGLILLTNNGELAYRLMHPSYQIEKEYIVRLKGIIKEKLLYKLKKGSQIDGDFLKVKDVKLLNKNTLDIILTEGKKREIRRLIANYSYVIKDLFRIAIGPIKLDNLKSGEYRELSIDEVKNLLISVNL